NRTELRLGGLDGTADATEQIMLPRRVKTGIVKLAFTSAPRRAGQRGGFAEEAVRVTSIGLHGRREVERGEPPQGAGLLEIRRGDAQVMIVCHGAVHEPIESCIVEAPPPRSKRGFIRGS